MCTRQQSLTCINLSIDFLISVLFHFNKMRLFFIMSIYFVSSLLADRRPLHFHLCCPKSVYYLFHKSPRLRFVDWNNHYGLIEFCPYIELGMTIRIWLSFHRDHKLSFPADVFSSKNFPIPLDYILFICNYTRSLHRIAFPPLGIVGISNAGVIQILNTRP